MCSQITYSPICLMQRPLLQWGLKWGVTAPLQQVSWHQSRHPLSVIELHINQWGWKWNNISIREIMYLFILVYTTDRIQKGICGVYFDVCFKRPFELIFVDK